MVFNYNDIVTIINLALSVVILVIGCWGYVKTKRQTLFFIGVAFGLFSVLHLITLMGVEKNFEATTILIRIFAYLITASSLIKMIKER